MLDQLGNPEGFEAFYTVGGVAKIGLSVTVNVRDPTGVQIVTGAAATEVGDGFYTYTLAASQATTAGTYRARFLTGDGTVDQKELPAIWILGKAWVANMDAAVSSRSTYAGGAVAAVLGDVGGRVVGSVGSVTAGVTVAANGDKAGYTLAAAGLDAIPVEAGVNVRQALSPILAAAAGVLTGAGSGTIVIKGGNVATTRITATTDASGNRSAVVLTLPS